MRAHLPITHRSLLITFLTIIMGIAAQAQTIKGNVTDAKTGQTLIGATVHIHKGSYQQYASVKLDGQYIFKVVPVGSYLLRVNTASGTETFHFVIGK